MKDMSTQELIALINSMIDKMTPDMLIALINYILDNLENWNKFLSGDFKNLVDFKDIF